MDRGLSPAPISVNISRANLYNPNAAQIIGSLVNQYGVPPRLLQLELTESAYMDNPQVMELFTEQLHGLGFTILMDDFGNGYSSLSILKNIPVDVLKIDMQFFEDTKIHGRGENIIASVIRMAKWLNIPTIAEGVEKVEQVNFLSSVGCDYVQGYFFAHPMTVDAYEKLITGNMPVAVSPTPIGDSLDVDRLWSTDPEIEILFSNATQANCIYEFDGVNVEVLRVNKVYNDLFGYDKEIKKTAPTDCILPEDRETVMQSFCKCVDEKRNEECMYRRKTLDGKVLWVHLRIQYVCPVGNKHIVFGHLTDVTSQKMMEFELNRFRDAVSVKTDCNRQLLIVDDAQTSVALLSKLFEKEFEILSASNGAEGLEVMRKNKSRLALILLDMLMPVMDGMEFLVHKNESPETAGIPVIVISADDDIERQTNMLRLGVNDYITKPFVPGVVERRVRNVLEYSSRFAAMVSEYQKALHLMDGRLFEINQVYTVPEMRMLMLFLSPVFDIIRLVDPVETAVVTLLEDGGIRREEYRCFHVWNKSTRCENCVSVCGLRGNCRMTKYEFIQNNVFYVISNPIMIEDNAGVRHHLALEIVSRVSDHIMLGSNGDKTIGQLIEETQKKIYTDELTGVYNRRYFSEMLFCHHGQTGIVKQMTLIMLDMQGFKLINDRYGHAIGDDVLMRTAKVLTNCVRQNDSVIRYGGDEFMVILTNCSEKQALMTIERLRAAISSVHYGNEDALTASADFGYAYTQQFDCQQGSLKNLIETADQTMYKEKRNRMAQK